MPTTILSDHLKCPSCHSPYSFQQSTPKLLKNCPHTICLTCLRTQSHCPIDHVQINASKYGVKSFLTDIRVLEEVQNGGGGGVLLGISKEDNKEDRQNIINAERFSFAFNEINSNNKGWTSNNNNRDKQNLPSILNEKSAIHNRLNYNKTYSSHKTSNHHHNHNDPNPNNHPNNLNTPHNPNHPNLSSSSYLSLCPIHFLPPTHICLTDHIPLCPSCISSPHHKSHPITTYQHLLSLLTQYTDSTYKIYEQVNVSFEPIDQHRLNSFIEQEIVKKKEREVFRVRKGYQECIEKLRKEEKELIAKMEVKAGEVIREVKEKVEQQVVKCKEDKDNWTKQVSTLTQVMEQLYERKDIDKALHYLDHNHTKSQIVHQGDVLLKEFNELSKRVKDLVEEEGKVLQCKLDEGCLLLREKKRSDNEERNDERSNDNKNNDITRNKSEYQDAQTQIGQPKRNILSLNRPFAMGFYPSRQQQQETNNNNDQSSVLELTDRQEEQCYQQDQEERRQRGLEGEEEQQQGEQWLTQQQVKQGNMSRVYPQPQLQKSTPQPRTSTTLQSHCPPLGTQQPQPATQYHPPHQPPLSSQQSPPPPIIAQPQQDFLLDDSTQYHIPSHQHYNFNDDTGNNNQTLRRNDTAEDHDDQYGLSLLSEQQFTPILRKDDDQEDEDHEMDGVDGEEGDSGEIYKDGEDKQEDEQQTIVKESHNRMYSFGRVISRPGRSAGKGQTIITERKARNINQPNKHTHNPNNHPTHQRQLLQQPLQQPQQQQTLPLVSSLVHPYPFRSYRTSPIKPFNTHPSNTHPSNHHHPSITSSSSSPNSFTNRSPLKPLPMNTSSQYSLPLSQRHFHIPVKYQPTWHNAKHDLSPTIDLTGAQLGPAAILYLCSTYLSTSKHLKSLKLIRNNLTDDSVERILQCLEGTNVASLNLSQNLLTEKVLEVIEKAELGKLRVITLSLNHGIVLRRVKDRVEWFRKVKGLVVTV